MKGCKVIYHKHILPWYLHNFLRAFMRHRPT